MISFFVLNFNHRENILMKFIRIFGVLMLMMPCVSWAAGTSEFQNASQLLTAARRGDIQTVQVLINNGTDVNYVDSTGLSVVCTAVMNNDKRAIQILQMYGADASNCDRQIKQYKQKSRVAARGEEGGFFSGLSSTHVLALSAVGVAAVIGGVALLTNVLDDNDGGGASGGSNGDRPNNNNSNSSTSTTTTQLFAQNLPYGPGCTDDDCSGDYALWEQETPYAEDFDFMSTGNNFNYLMVAHAYDAFVRGYLGMTTVRNDSTREIFNLSDPKYPFDQTLRGGKPINVATITASGVNATGSAVDGLIYWFDANKRNSLVSLCTNSDGTFSQACIDAVNSSVKMSHKYFNLTGATVDNATETTSFDLSGSGSVFGMATDSDTKLAKIIAGWEGDERSNPDFYGFIPNGQLTVYKTGGGNMWVDTTSSSVTAAYLIAGDELAVNDKFTLSDNTVLTVTSVSENSFHATDSSDNEYSGYLIGNNLFIDSNADGNINQMYVLGDENALTLTKELVVADYKNYAAIYKALSLKDSGKYVANVVANLSQPVVASELGYADVDDALVLYNNSTTDALKNSTFLGLIDNYYNLNTTDDSTVNKPSIDADNAFTYLKNNQEQILVNPAGHSLFGLGTGQSLSPQLATFENFAPVIYPGLQNLFMTVVAVKPANGTDGNTINGYTASGAGKLELSTWTDTDDNVYMSRMCGLSGTGNGGALNPWCFAAPGNTDLEATAAMAGAIALVNSAFDYMKPQEIFLLLALTADGPYLGKYAWSETHDSLLEYLQDMYTLPGSINTSDTQYMDDFKKVFGYGMINLERATRPGTNVYFYDSDTNSIVSSSGKDAFWGKVSTTTNSSRASTVLSLSGRGAITTSFYDVIQSADGTISLPRVWNATLNTDNYSRHALYMGDVLGEFNVDSTNRQSNQIGDFTFNMSTSQRAYNDNMNGLDNLSVSFKNEKYDIDANYQRFLTDGLSRFDGRANGVLSLVSNSVGGGAKYKYGNFAFGTRAFSGIISDENLLQNDPVVSSQFEPARLGLANGISVDGEYKNDSFAFNVAIGNLHENNTVLGAYSDGLLTMRGGDTKYIDAVMTYNPIEKLKLFARATFADTDVNTTGGIISNISNIKSNAFALGTNIGGFEFTVAMPLAVVDGKLGYDYADFDVVENGGKYEIAMNNPHIEYVDLSAQKREMRFSTSYKKSVGKFTDAGIGLIYRINPNHSDTFGNESMLMFKIHHRLGI